MWRSMFEVAILPAKNSLPRFRTLLALMMPHVILIRSLSPGGVPVGGGIVIPQLWGLAVLQQRFVSPPPKLTWRSHRFPIGVLKNKACFL